MIKENNKIFNIGFNKSGTTSLTEAMNILGYKSIHYNKDNEFIYDLINNNRKNNKKLLDGLEGFDFFADFQGMKFYKELDKQYPGSKFILTIRELNSWLDSRERHVKRNQKNPNKKTGWLKVDREKWKKDREEKICELKEYFKGRPEDFLIIDIIGGDGWEKLCNFLFKPIPSKPFPYLNKAPSFLGGAWYLLKVYLVKFLRKYFKY